MIRAFIREDGNRTEARTRGRGSGLATGKRDKDINRNERVGE